MTPTESQPVRPPSSGRRTVKIVKHRSPTRATMISLGLTGGAAVAIPFLWTLAREPVVPPARLRNLSEQQLDWRCENGDTFTSPGRTGHMICPYCGASAYPIAFYSCPVHGPKEVEIEFGETPEGEMEIVRLRLLGRDWVLDEKQLRCPQCNRRLHYDKEATLRDQLRRHQQSND